MSPENADVLEQIRQLLEARGPAPSAPPSGPTFGDVWARYWREEGRHLKSAKVLRWRGSQLLAAWKERPMLDCNTDAAEAYRNPLWTVRMEAENNIKSSKIRSEEELQRLLAVCDPYLRAGILLGIDSGMRRSEFLSLQWTQINVITRRGKKQITAELWETKNGQRRRVGITERAWAAIQALPKVDRFIFVGREPGNYRAEGAEAPLRPNSHLHADGFGARFKRACRRAGLLGPDGKPLTLHDLRHSFAYLARVVHGLPEQSIMKQGGWRTRSAFDRYGIGGEEELAAMYDAINDSIRANIERLQDERSDDDGGE